MCMSDFSFYERTGASVSNLRSVYNKKDLIDQSNILSTTDENDDIKISS